MDKIPLEEQAVAEYLDDAIRSWRRRKQDAAGEDRLVAECYIDAFQSVRTSLLGSTLPREEQP